MILKHEARRWSTPAASNAQVKGLSDNGEKALAAVVQLGHDVEKRVVGPDSPDFLGPDFQG